MPAWLSGDLGLAYGRFTLILGLALTALWLVTVPLLRRRGHGWRAVPLSLLGWSWIGFGLAFVARFWVLSVDAVSYGDMSERLLGMPPSVIDQALLLSLAYWGSVLLAYRLIPARSFNPLASLDSLVGWHAVAMLDALALVSVVAMVLGADLERTPPALVRPLALVGSLWVVPATTAWFLALGSRRRRLAVRRWVYLLPGLLSFALEPFRERLLLMLLIPLLAALFAGRRPRLAPWLVVLALFAIASTLAVSWYRQVAWEGESVTARNEYLDPSVWRKEPYYAPWTAVLRRFHSFDSLVFHAYLVPDVVPFESERNPLVDLLLEGFVPRALWPDKPESRRAMIFSVTLWSYGEDTPGPEANIAPSMAGDLYGVGGWLWVVIGGAAWGALLGGLDRWRERLSPGGQAIVVSTLALLAAGGIERDFPRAAATLVQSAIVLIAAAVAMRRALGVARGRMAGSPESAGWTGEPAQAP